VKRREKGHIEQKERGQRSDDKNEYDLEDIEITNENEW
jgi:hypothetical protein